MAENVLNTISYDDSIKSNVPKVTDFDNFLPWACKKFAIDAKVFVIRTDAMNLKTLSSAKTQSKKSRQSKLVHSTIRSELGSSDDKESSSDASAGNENAVIVETLYDDNENLVQLKFLKNKTIPQDIMKVVALTIPYHKHLTAITINSGLHMKTLHEISKFLPDSNIIELCLDSTFISNANYHTLLTHSKLKYLSLARCSINDATVKTIIDQLIDPHPAAKVLSILNLSSNRITDVGATYVAGKLRKNRQLSYLNLSGNMISDEGGTRILDALQKFPLEAQELFESRARYVAFLKKKRELVKTIIKELQAAKEDKNPKKGNPKKGKESQSQPNFANKPDAETGMARKIQEEAACLAESHMGLFDDCFSPNNTESKDGVVRCFGNNILCCLNLAYNNLTYVSVKKLRDVLQTQMSLNRTPRGLIKVVIRGNLIPEACKEYDEINRFLEARLVGVRKHSTNLTKKKTLSAISKGKDIKSVKSSFN